MKQKVKKEVRNKFLSHFPENKIQKKIRTEKFVSRGGIGYSTSSHIGDPRLKFFFLVSELSHPEYWTLKYPDHEMTVNVWGGYKIFHRGFKTKEEQEKINADGKGRADRYYIPLRDEESYELALEILRSDDFEVDFIEEYTDDP